MATDTLAVTNLVARGYDPNVTSGGFPNEINVMAEKLNVKSIAAVNSGSAVKINGDVSITGEVKDTLIAENAYIEKDLEVGGRTTFNGPVTFHPLHGVVIPELTVTTELDIQGKVSGLASNYDSVATDKIQAKTEGKSIDVADPLRNLEAVVRYGQVKWMLIRRCSIN